MLVGAAAACAALALLYGIMAGPGKQTIGSGTSACAESSKTASRINPLAVDKLAALAVPKQPKPMTDLTFNDPDGKKITLAAFRGKTVLLNLWATWCVPCRAEMPALDALQKALGSDVFEVVAINIDTARLERRKPFLESIGVKSLRFYTDEQADTFQTLKQSGKVLGLPATFLIDPKGCEIGRMAGPADWDSDQAKKLIRAALGQ